MEYMYQKKIRQTILLASVVACTLFSTQLKAQTWEDFAGGYIDADNDSLYLDPMDSLDISEIVFRHLFVHNNAVKRKKSKNYIISWFHAANHRYIDPSGPFIARFYDIKPRVKKASYYYLKKKKFEEGEVIFFFITDIFMRPDGRVEAHGGYYQSDKACAGNRYILKNDGGVWIIDSSVLEWTL